MSIKKEKGFLCADEVLIEGFDCTCKKCGSKEVGIEDNVSMGSDWTGVYGSVDLICRECGNCEAIMQA